MRRTGLTIQFTGLGNGEVNTVMARDLLLPSDRTLYSAPPSPNALNCRLLDGVVAQRFGYHTIGNTPASSAVTGLFQATFDNNTVENLRSDAAGTYYLVGGTTWTSISSPGVGGNWCYAMARRAGGASVANQVLLSADGDSDSVWRYVGNGTAASTIGAATGGSGSGFRGARAVLGHRGRGLVMNTYDVGLVARKIKRVNYSILGDPSIYTGFGSGFVDLDDDPFPIVNAKVIGGNVCVFNGNNMAGSLVVGTLTGVTNSPYRWDTINTDNVGLLVPRSLVLVTSNLAFFLGHSGFFLYDGARGLSPVAEGVSRDILSRINPAALKAGFAWFKPKTGEVYVALPMGNATLPSETWVFNFAERRVYGPYTFAHTLTSACPYVTTDAVTWNTSVGTWDSNAYPNWDAAGGLASSRAVLLGASNGTTWLDDELTLTDGGTTIGSVYTFAPIRASGRILVMSDGSQRPLEEDGYLTLRDITLTYRNQGSWTPSIDVSVDGGLTFTAATTGTAIGTSSTNLDRSVTAPYSFDGLSGTWFQARVSGSTPMELLGLRMEFTYGGNARSD
jgi:hypothetical protein